MHCLPDRSSTRDMSHVERLQVDDAIRSLLHGKVLVTRMTVLPITTAQDPLIDISRIISRID